MKHTPSCIGRHTGLANLLARNSAVDGEMFYYPAKGEGALQMQVVSTALASGESCLPTASAKAGE